MHFLLFYEVDADYAARRVEFRDAHLQKAWAASARGELLLGGALANPLDGAVLLFQADSADVPRRFAEQDPYVVQGLVKRWYVRDWTTVVGEAAAQPIGAPAALPAEDVPVARVWRGRAAPARAQEYVDFFRRRVVPQLRAIEGQRGIHLLRQAKGAVVEFTVLTLWQSMAAVRRFAGADPRRAVVEPEARTVLDHFDETVAHYEDVTIEDRAPAARAPSAPPS